LLVENLNFGTIAAHLTSWKEFVSSENLITEGFSLMLMGMGTVFVFLTLLVFVTSFMSSLIQKYLPETSAEVLPTAAASLSSGKNNPALLAVISAAIHAHRSSNSSNNRQSKNKLTK
jgi:oxaloacetate decarboxylase (Na+ extruding) subunit gamma